MDPVLYFIAGTTLGVITGLVPGLHSNLILLLITSSLGVGLSSSIFIVSAAGAALYTHRLAFTFHPVATLDTASLDPALRLMSKGKGHQAIDLMIKAADRSLVILAVVGLVILLLDRDLITFIQTNSKPLATLAIILWLVLTSLRHKLAWVGLLLTSIYGYTVVHHPQIRGNEHALLPILTGLIGIPMLMSVLIDPDSKIPKQYKTKSKPEQVELSVFGTGLGLATGFLAGLGTSSLVSLLEDRVKTDEEYIYLSTSTEVTNSVTAIILMLALGIGRSGEAVLLGRQIPNPTNLEIGLILCCLSFSVLTGRYITKQIVDTYVELAQKLPLKLVTTLLLVISTLSLGLMGNWTVALLATIPGVIISLFIRKLNMPNQVMFGCLTGPILIQYLGLIESVNKLLGI